MNKSFLKICKEEIMQKDQKISIDPQPFQLIFEPNVSTLQNNNEYSIELEEEDQTYLYDYIEKDSFKKKKKIFSSYRKNSF